MKEENNANTMRVPLKNKTANNNLVQKIRE